MTVDELVAVLDDHGFGDTSSARKIEVLTDTIWEIEAEGPWTFLEEEASMTLSSRTPTLPSDFGSVKDIVIPSLSMALQPETFDVLAKMFTDLTLTGQPLYYYFIGEELNIYPVPSTSYTSKIQYYKSQALLVAGQGEATILIPKKHHRAIIYGALVKLYSMEDDPELATVFANLFSQRMARMRADYSTKQHDRPKRVYDLFESDDIWIDV